MQRTSGSRKKTQHACQTNLGELDNGRHVNIWALNHLVRAIVAVVVVLIHSTHLQSERRAPNRRTRAQTKAEEEEKTAKKRTTKKLDRIA